MVGHSTCPSSTKPSAAKRRHGTGIVGGEERAFDLEHASAGRPGSSTFLTSALSKLADAEKKEALILVS